MQAPLVELRRVSKSFGATRALADVSFAIQPGEVHVLAGENGAGKSTLIRILSGVLTDFEGELLIAGANVRFRDARDAARHGIATIHQELSLVGSMSVADNLALARPGALFGWTRAADDVRSARAILAGMELDIDPHALVETLPIAAQQLLEIARALAQNARVLVLDEPTSALADSDASLLLARIERLAASGCGIVYISHRMEENDRLAHHITVLRDSRVVASCAAKELPREALVALLMGRENAGESGGENVSENVDHSAKSTSEGAPPPTATAPNNSSAHDSSASDPSASDPSASDPSASDPSASETSASETSASDPPLFEVRDLHLDLAGISPLRGVSFSVARGEIVGLAGLRGSGISETLAALFGAFGDAPRAEVRLDGAPFFIVNPARSIDQGLLFLANDRKKSVLYDLDIRENIALSSLPRLAPFGVPSATRETTVARDLTARLRVAAPSLRAPLRDLSGGNQQKVALLRCLAAKPSVLLLDEPTRGVDVGAKADIHDTLRTLAAGGKGIVLVASELSELTKLCDRIVVLARGRVSETLARTDFSHARLRLALDGPPAPRTPTVTTA